MAKLRYLLIGLAAGTLAACGPVYKTTYDLTPPQSAEGKLCVTQCQQTTTACKQSGYDRYQRCKSEREASAERSFNEYRIQQLLQKKPITKSKRHFYAGYSCSSEASYRDDCGQDFIGCFATCGGKVTPHTVCTANCEKAQTANQLILPPPPAKPQ